MHTTLGRQFLNSSRNLVIASLVGALAVASDFALVAWNNNPVSFEGRGVVALLALSAYLYLVRGDLVSVGLTGTTAEGLLYWVRAAVLIGLVVAGCIVVGYGLWVQWGHELPVYTTPPQGFGTAFLRMCVIAPVLEEVLYRLVICVPLAGWGRPRLAVAVSGLMFAVLHLVYGNPSPENLLGGLFLAWVYLRSGTICLPVLLHSLGNFCVLLGQLGGWYWLGGSGQ